MSRLEALPSAENHTPEIEKLPGNGLLKKRNASRHRLGYGAKLPALEPDQVPLVGEVARRLSASLIPATPVEIGRLIDGLLWHYPRPERPEEAEESVVLDWVRDLGHLPADIIDAACTAWRRAPNSYAPTPGHLLEIARPILAARQFWHRMAEKELEPFASVGSVSPGGVVAGGASLSAGGVSKLRRGA